MNGSQSSSAAEAFRRAVELLSQRCVTEALTGFDHAEALGHNADECGAHRWQCWMLLGNFEEAWRESDRISLRGGPDPHALWDGLPFAGKRVVIRCLHGYGDAIQFLRYAPLVRSSAARVIVETHPEMVSLLAGQGLLDQVVTWADGSSPAREHWDQQIEVTELPRAFRTTISNIPARIPYLTVSREARERSIRQLGSANKPFRIGLVWASSRWNPARSIPLELLRPVLGCDRCAFYSFQHSAERAELAQLDGRFQIADTAAHSPEIAHTAAHLTCMDLLITVDTMAAHLAGALGLKVWTLLPWEADWRWMIGREDTPWYPAMRLFRQPSPGNWEAVVEKVAGELKAFCR